MAAAAALATLAADCGGPACGPGTTPTPGVTATASGTVITYGNFTSSPNNDCTPTPGAPTSLTVTGTQTDPATSKSFSITLCLPRPDKIGSAPISLANTDLVRVIDVSAGVDGCSLGLDRSGTVSGTVQFSGFCANGTDSHGYALSFDGTAPAELTCPTDGGTPKVTKQQVALAGAAAVTAVGQGAAVTAVGQGAAVAAAGQGAAQPAP